MFKKLLLISAILIFSVKDLIAKDIPIIVIAQVKKTSVSLQQLVAQW